MKTKKTLSSIISTSAIVALLLNGSSLFAQVGVGTAAPNSTLDIRGSVAISFKNITASYAVTINDYHITYTGVGIATVTLPDAAACTGRIYSIKNSSATVPTPVLTVATTSAQTLDGSTTWLLDIVRDQITVMSNGANWDVVSMSSSSVKDDLSTGNIYVSTPGGVTACPVAGTAYKLVATTTLVNAYRTVMPANNRLQYTGTKTRTFQVICSLTGTQTSSNQIYTLSIAKTTGGVTTVLPESEQTIKFSNSADYKSVTLSCIVTLAKNDFIEVYIENTAGTTGFTIQALNLAIK